VVSNNQTTPLWVYGQNLAYDSINNITFRFNQQNLGTSSPVRAEDFCDYIQVYFFDIFSSGHRKS